MIVECASCPVRGLRCDGCVVTVLAAVPVRVPMPGVADPDADGLVLDAEERRAVGAFVAAGLVDREYAATLRARRRQPGRGGGAVASTA